MYIGTFDNATNIQSQTVTKFLMKLKYASNSESKLKGPTLKQIYAPFYEVLSHQQHIWVMDENERITAADSANALLKGTTNDYVWRFVEHKGRLYAGTFDSSTAYNYFLGTHIDDFLEEICAVDTGIPQSSRELFSGKILKRVRTLAASFISKRKKNANNSLQSKADDLMEAAENTSQILEKFYEGDCTVDEVLVAIKALKESRSAITDDQVAAMDSKDFSSLVEKVDTILNFFDVEGLVYWAKARTLVRKEAKGFDLLTTTDGEHWDRILDDGIKDRYNYGGRTFTVCNNELYVGTANPYYGAQLWKITDLSAPDDKVASKPRLSKKSVKVKKGKTVKVKIIGKTPGTKITYKNTKYAKITSKRTASVLKVKGLKKGKTTLKIKVNGVTLKLKVTVK